MRIKVKAVFDIGKTNKKFFLFDENFKEVYKVYAEFEEILDDDGHPSEDIRNLKKWALAVFDKALDDDHFEIESLNFSTYGASFVHIGESGEVVGSLYNYTKKYDEALARRFYERYGPMEDFCQQTASSNLGWLNSGLQLYWIKHLKSDLHQKIKYSLHLPQYLSYIFTGDFFSEYTSIGCHTGLWDYEKKDYHKWVYEEGIDHQLPEIVPTSTKVIKSFKGRQIVVGVGIHDSSAALIPYLWSSIKPFLLLSTGTWSIALNPFSKDSLTKSELAEDCLFNMRMNGETVKASRLFLGNEYKVQIKRLREHFGLEKGWDKEIKFSKSFFESIRKQKQKHFVWQSLKNKNDQQLDLKNFRNKEEVYHQLMMELVWLQAESIKTCLGNSEIKQVYVDGGFADNEVFIEILKYYFEEMAIRMANSPIGSALGAAIVISKDKLAKDFLERVYGLE